MVGQIGSELILTPREKYGKENVVISETRNPREEMLSSGPLELLNVTDSKKMKKVVKDYDIDSIFHLAALLCVV